MQFYQMTSNQKLSNKEPKTHCPPPAVLIKVLEMEMMMKIIMVVMTVMTVAVKVMTAATLRADAVFVFLSPCVTTHRQLWLLDHSAHPHP